MYAIYRLVLWFSKVADESAYAKTINISAENRRVRALCRGIYNGRIVVWRPLICIWWYVFNNMRFWDVVYRFVERFSMVVARLYGRIKIELLRSLDLCVLFGSDVAYSIRWSIVMLLNESSRIIKYLRFRKDCIII